MYRVFLIHNTSPEEMVLVWRLQTLAAASGLHLDVPNLNQRQNSILIDQMIEHADSVIVLVTRAALDSVHLVGEIQMAQSKGRTIIPIFEKGVPTESMNELKGSTVFFFDPQEPWEMESKLSQFLTKQATDKETRNSILALAATFAGVFLLSRLSEN